jgi:hypothetical protein
MQGFLVRLSLLLVIGAAIACGPGPVKPVPIEEAPEKQALLTAGKTTVVGQTTLSLNASVWLNDMPGADSKGILVSATVTAYTGGTFPAGASLGGIYVIHGDQVWRAGVDEERPLHPGSHEGVSREGPSWPAGVSTDVVVRIDEAGGTSSYVAARGVTIVSAQ